MKTLHGKMAETLDDGAPAASPREARASAMLGGGGRRSKRQSVAAAQLSVDGKSPINYRARQRAVAQRPPAVATARHGRAWPLRSSASVLRA